MSLFLSVLIVDDEIEHFENLSDFLEENFYVKTYYASDGIMALQKIDKQDFDFIFLDNHMPKMKGVPALEFIRKIPKHYETPIFLMSASLETVDVKKSMSYGVKEIFVKPYDVDKLIDKVRQIIIEKHSNLFIIRKV